MKTIVYNPTSHYPILSQWWSAQGWPVIPESMLPITGVVSTHEDKPVAAGFIYTTNSKVAISEFVVADPDAPRNLKDDALDSVVSGMSELAKILGAEVIFSMTPHRKLLDRYKKHGYNITDDNVTLVLKQLYG